jgi:hypothetical protein
MKTFTTHKSYLMLTAATLLLLAGRAAVPDEAVEVEVDTVAPPTDSMQVSDDIPDPFAESEPLAPTSADGDPVEITFGNAPADPAAATGAMEDMEDTAAGVASGASHDDPELPAGEHESYQWPGEDPASATAISGQAGTQAEDDGPMHPEGAGIAIDPLTEDAAQETAIVPLADAVTVATATTARTITMLRSDVLPGTYQRLSWSATEMFEDLPISTPILVVNGTTPGPTLCLTAAVHGDELNGIEMVRRVMHDLNPQELAGAVIGVPIVNLQGFRRASRYLPDRRDLNRYFPGNPRGSAASRIAHSFFTEVIEHCDALIDLHTGSFDRANLPQIRADLRNPDVVTLTHGFGATVVLHSEPAEGTLRHAASHAGIPTVTLEAGGPSELELREVMHGVKGIETLLNTLGMVDKMRHWGDQQPVYYRSTWVRANRGGILLADVSLGGTVRRGDLLGTITDPMNNARTNLYSPYSGRVLGMARNQVVMPGFAAFHVGIQAAEASTAEAAIPEAEKPLESDAEIGEEDYVDGMSE